MIRFSANLGFLWKESPLPEAIHLAKNAGFEAVECHWPYEFPSEDVSRALVETGLPMLGLNTSRGNVEAGDNGLAAIPGRKEEARAAIDEAVAYADAIDCQAIHVMCGFAEGDAARNTFIDNLGYAATKTQRPILIEPLNRHDAPGYFLETTDQARDIIEDVGLPNVKLMFDCYHVGRTEGDITTRLKNLQPIIGHIQFASVPERDRPDRGEINFSEVFAVIDELGWSNPLGAEYKPKESPIDDLSWMETLLNR